jgi:hypothetical protein
MTTIKLKAKYLSNDLLPVCAWCGSVRDKQNKWHKINLKKIKFLNFNLTHGICPKCTTTVY